MTTYYVCDERDMADQTMDADHLLESFQAGTDRAAFFEALNTHRGISWVLFKHVGTNREPEWVAQHTLGANPSEEAPMRHPA